MTMVVAPRGTLPDGATTMWAFPPTPKVPVLLVLIAEWLVVTPPTVMEPDAMVELAGKPYPSSRKEVGDAPGKLNAVSPVCVL